jgi:multidrug resistance efflux pump
MPGTPSNAANQVTHAIQGQKIDTLTAAVITLTADLNHFMGEMRESNNLLKTQSAVHTEQIDSLKDGLTENKLDLVDCDNKIDGVIQKTNWWSGVNTTLSLIANTIAAYVGFTTGKF